jgi:DNA-binding NarL/FixJ family response regulator
MSSDCLQSIRHPLTPENTIWVLIVDDHAVVRQGLRTFLELHDQVPPDDPSALPVEVMSGPVNGVEAVDLARRLQPDVILLDLVMPEMDGIEATQQIRDNGSTCRVVALTVYGDPASQNRAADAGVDPFLVKEVSVEGLVQAISAPLDPKGSWKPLGSLSTWKGQ